MAATALPDVFFKIIGRTLTDNDTKFIYQLQQVPNPNAPVPSVGAGMDGSPGAPSVTSERDIPINEGTLIKVTRAWEVYQSA